MQEVTGGKFDQSLCYAAYLTISHKFQIYMPRMRKISKPK